MKMDEKPITRETGRTLKGLTGFFFAGAGRSTNDSFIAQVRWQENIMVPTKAMARGRLKAEMVQTQEDIAETETRIASSQRITLFQFAKAIRLQNICRLEHHG